MRIEPFVSEKISMKMRLMIVDDHSGMRTAIKALIAAPGDIVIECASGDEALEALTDFRPDCVTVDVNMPGRCAFETMRAIRKAHPGARIVCVTSHDQVDFRRAAFEAGAAGYVAKDDLSDLYLLVATKRLIVRTSQN
jgi:DNA-binding NarL/FixJ family response regulator